jgi:hypothetical protein
MAVNGGTQPFRTALCVVHERLCEAVGFSSCWCGACRDSEVAPGQQKTIETFQHQDSPRLLAGGFSPWYKGIKCYTSAFGCHTEHAVAHKKVADPFKTLASLPSLTRNHCYFACRPEAPCSWRKHLQVQNVLLGGEQGCYLVEAVDPFAKMRLCINVR